MITNDIGEHMLRKLGIDEQGQRRFENMMIGYFGLRDQRALYRLRGAVEMMREVFDRDDEEDL